MEIDYLAVFLAALSGFILGGLWYSPILFGKAWQKEVGLSDEQIQSGNMAKVFGISFLLSLLAAFVFHMFLGPDIDMATGALYGLSAGVAWVGSSFGINYLFEQKSLRLFGINAGYHSLQFMLIGLVLGAV
ncbi:hypothetical protein GCM10007972_13660 [Iodidimonas muriae]|uniref:DUF1761 domain-containing protein n=1 Tax=Iodidimonas muriae TaxID=261467 RepID=A0ABQ2LCP8_9PROT|nr:DUF1761 domain-containing protein [Iodidimonas muriae]GER07405.1 hypothetical protein JCM17843_17150 [Kordiimonadales bacterium JCM 17843]GGO10624.1 hypothetical protein GCM10007972_13660 [Iodidimonas muriae]